MNTSNPGIGHNFPPSMTEDDCKALALVAFQERDQVEVTLGTAVQRMAAACMAHHANMVLDAAKANETAKGNDKRVEVIALSKVCDPKEAMGRATLQARMVGFFIPNRVVGQTKTSTEKTGKRSQQEKHVTLIRDGLELASILALHSVELTAYKPEMGLWEIPSALVCKDGYAVDTDAKTLILDGSAWVSVKRVAGGKPEYDSFVASVRRLKDIRKPKQEREGNAGGNDTDGATIRKQVSQLMLVLRSTDNGKRIYNKLSDLEDPDRNALTALVQFYNSLKAADAPATKKAA